MRGKHHHWNLWYDIESRSVIDYEFIIKKLHINEGAIFIIQVSHVC